MSDPDDALKGALRDLIPDYAGPVDPLPRVVASVRRRRFRQRTLLAVASAGAAAVVALGAPALIPTGVAGGQAAAPGGAAASGGPTAPVPEPPAYRVARGSVGAAQWEIGSVSLADGATTCLTSDDDLFDRDTVCFDSWEPGAPVTWAAQRIGAVTRVTGVAPRGTASVLVRFADGTTVSADAVVTPTDPAARFFGLVVEGGPVVRNVTALDPSAVPLGRPVGPPGAPACIPRPGVDCAPG